MRKTSRLRRGAGEGARFPSTKALGSFMSASRTKQLAARCCRILAMSLANADFESLRERLRALDTEFDRKMRARGFDPAQAENVALPSHLATLYAEREQIRSQLAELEGKTND